MESNLTQFLKKSNKSLEKIFKKTELRASSIKCSKHGHNPKSPFETTVLPLIYVKQSVKQNRKNIYTYPSYNKQDLNSSYDTKDNDSEKNSIENGSNYNVNSKSLNNFSKILVTLKVKKETSLRNNILNNDQLPLLKTAIHNYNTGNISSYTDYNNNINSNKINNLNSIKRKNIYSPIEFLENSQVSTNYDKKRAHLIQISESPVSNSQIEQTSRVQNLKDRSLIWKNMDKFLNTKSPENPPGTPNLY